MFVGVVCISLIIIIIAQVGGEAPVCTPADQCLPFQEMKALAKTDSNVAKLVADITCATSRLTGEITSVKCPAKEDDSAGGLLSVFSFGSVGPSAFINRAPAIGGGGATDVRPNKPRCSGSVQVHYALTSIQYINYTLTHRYHSQLYVNSDEGLKFLVYRKSRPNLGRRLNKAGGGLLLLRVDGNCCWRVFDGVGRGGASTRYVPGYSGSAPGHRVGSLIKSECGKQ